MGAQGPIYVVIKIKAGTNYVNNELAKKANTTILDNYVLKIDLPSNNALEDYAFMTELQTLASDVSGLLHDKVDYRDLANYSLTSAINNSLSTKANQRNVGNDLALKANLSDVNNLC